MGVTGLWMLLAAAGREVSIESLSGQTLAVDASIWLTQFVKAMRDPEDGSMLRNAHLLGTFQRVAKLLFHGIRPVFVFDGDTPALKKITLQRRRARREKNQLSLTQTAQKLLLRQLEKRAKQAATERNDSAEQQEESKQETIEDEESVQVLDESGSDEERMDNWRDQHEHVEAYQREKRQEAREQFLTLAGKPEEYSLAQIKTFLKASRFNREMKQQLAASNETEEGHRIASESDRRYILTSAQEGKKKPSVQPAQGNQLVDLSDASIGRFSEYVQMQSQKKKCLDDDDIALDEQGKPLLLEAKHPEWFDKAKKREAVVWEKKDDGTIEASFDPSKLQLTEKEARILPPSLFDTPLVPDSKCSPKEKIENEEWGDVIEIKSDGGFEDDSEEWEDVVVSASPTGNGQVHHDEEDIEEKAPPPANITSDDEEETKEDTPVMQTRDGVSDTEWEDVVPDESSAPQAEEESVIDLTAPEEPNVIQNVIATPPSSPVFKSGETIELDEVGFENRISMALQDEDEELVTLGLAKDSDALQAVMTTASNLTQWAAGAVKRAILDHQSKHSNTTTIEEAPRYLTRTTPEPIKPIESSLSVIPKELNWTHETDEQLLRARNQQMRDAEGVTEDMKNEVMDLLRLFGVPFIVAPMEAEAQCATLEQLGLVNGVITDDSDIFAFGGKKVYKNMFKTTKFVEAFYMDDIGRELGLDQESMIALALLLGSDYTDGIHGVGIVNATEIVHAFPGIDGLRQFKAWVNEFDLAAQLQPHAKVSESDLAGMDPLERFKHTHHKVRRNWTIGEAFPNPHVVKAYLEPETDRSEARFSWATPDLANLRVFCGRAFGWPLEKVNATLLPIVQAAARGWFETQTRIDSYFTSYKDDVKYAKIRSKRLQAVVESINTSKKKKPRRKAKE